MLPKVLPRVVYSEATARMEIWPVRASYAKVRRGTTTTTHSTNAAVPPPASFRIPLRSEELDGVVQGRDRRGAHSGLVLVAVVDGQPAAGLTPVGTEGDCRAIVQTVQAWRCTQCTC